MYKKILLCSTLLAQCQWSVASNNQECPWDKPDLFDDFPPVHTISNNCNQAITSNTQSKIEYDFDDLSSLEDIEYNNNSNNNSNNNESMMDIIDSWGFRFNSFNNNFNTIIAPRQSETNCSSHNNEQNIASSSSSSSSSFNNNTSNKRMLENDLEQNNEPHKKAKISSTEFTNKESCNLKWNDTYKEFEYLGTENRWKRLPTELSLIIIEYLNPSQDERQNVFNNFKNSFTSVNGTKLINYLSILHVHNKLQSIQEPCLPTRPHPLQDSDLFQLLCTPIKLRYHNKSNYDHWDTYKIYTTYKQQISYYKTHYWMMKKLLENGADANASITTSLINETPLCCAASFNEKGQNNYPSAIYSSAINYIVAETASANLINLLLAHGANPNKKSYSDRSHYNNTMKTTQLSAPLHDAVRYNNLLAVRALLQQTSMTESFTTNINNKDNQGNTALHLAIKNNNPEIVKFLLESGANTTIKNFSKKTLFHCIISPQLNQYYLTKNLNDLDNIYQRGIQITELLLQHGVDKTVRDARHKTIMDIAFEKITKATQEKAKYEATKKKQSFGKKTVFIQDRVPRFIEEYQHEIKFYQDIIKLLSAQP